MKIIDLNKEKKSEYRLTEPGEYVAYMKNISGEFSFRIEAENIDLKIFGMFDAHNEDIYKIHTVQHHIAPRSTSNLLIKGVFNDASKFKYTGLVKIEKGAQGSHAYQKNQNLILSSKAFVESEPFLEIEANEVFCTHGSTTGKLNEEEIYYLRSRGINEAAARKALIAGFLKEIEDKMQSYASLSPSN